MRIVLVYFLMYSYCFAIAYTCDVHINCICLLLIHEKKNKLNNDFPLLRVRRTNLYRADRFYCPCAQILLFRVYSFNSLIFLSLIGRNAKQCFFAKCGRHTVVFTHIINTGISIKKNVQHARRRCHLNAFPTV